MRKMPPVLSRSSWVSLKSLLLLSLFFLVTFKGKSQSQPQIIVHLINGMTEQALANVVVKDFAANILGTTDQKGFVCIQYIKTQGAYLIASLPNYVSDTFKLIGTADTLQRSLWPLLEVMEGVTVSSDPVHRMFRSNIDYVEDYVFENGGKLIVLSYRGAFASRQKLSLVDGNGRTVDEMDINGSTVKLFQSCMGGKYIFSHDSVQRVLLTDSSIQAGPKKHIFYSGFKNIMACQLQVEKEFYFRNFHYDTGVLFSVVHAPSNRFNDFYCTANESVDYYKKEMKWITSTTFAANHKAYGDSKDALRKLYKDVALDFAKMERCNIYLKEDSILIIDVNKKIFVLLDRFSLQVQRIVPFRFSTDDILKITFLKDEVGDRYYMLQPLSERTQRIQEVDPNTGALMGLPQTIARKWISLVKVQDGKIYFLFQPTNGTGKIAATRSLYLQAAKL